MAEKVLENRICQACGSNVRPGALFCYACGSSVAPAMPIESKDNRAREKTNNAPSRNGEAKQSATPDIGAIGKPDENLPVEFHSKPNIDVKPAAPRRENRAAREKTVKVVWEETEGEANVWFLIIAFVLVGFAVLALVAMLSLE